MASTDDKKFLTRNMEHSETNTQINMQAVVRMKSKRKRKERNKNSHSKPRRGLSKFEKRYSKLGSDLIPEQPVVDYVLVFAAEYSKDFPDNPSKQKSLQKKEEKRERFENKLHDQGFSISHFTKDKRVYVELRCPFKRLCAEAEKVKLEMPLTGCEKYEDAKSNCLSTWIDRTFKTDSEVDFVSAPFVMDSIHLFEKYQNPNDFFRPALRSLLTYHVLINIDIREKESEGSEETTDIVQSCLADACSCCPYFTKTDKEDRMLHKMGLPYLLMKEVYTDAFILHDESERSKVHESNMKKNEADEKIPTESFQPEFKLDSRKDMNDTWTKFWKFQPIWKIRNYFGEKIALYFAWCGYLILSLWIPTLFGLGCFGYGLFKSISASGKQRETTNSTSGVTTHQQDDHLADSLQNSNFLFTTDLFAFVVFGQVTRIPRIRVAVNALLDTIRESFDNEVTPYFALVICLWGTIFLEMWKQHNARLAYEWDVDEFEAQEPDRPQFFGTKVKKDPVTQFDIWFYPVKRQLLKIFTSGSILIVMVMIVIISVVAVIVYRVIMFVDFCPNFNAAECLLTTTIVSAVLNAVSILLLGLVYDKMALKLTEWENFRTQTQFNDALIMKLFAFQFANSYASCFYVAFFRGRFDAFGILGLGEVYKDDCKGGSCMSQLSFQILTLMLAKPFPKLLKDFIIPFIKKLCHMQPACCCHVCCQNQVSQEKRHEEENISIEQKYHRDYVNHERSKPDTGDFTITEYTEKIILYGFLMLFAASFPLAPLLAMLVLVIDIRVDAKRLLWWNRRPVAFIAEDIGMWYGILNFVNLCGVISNGFLIAFTSTWGSKYTDTEKLWIVIGFEHIVFALKFCAAYLIPDVPSDVKLSIRREKYQIAKLLHGKEDKTDYRQLVPSTDAKSKRSRKLSGTIDEKEEENEEKISHSLVEPVPRNDNETSHASEEPVLGNDKETKTAEEEVKRGNYTSPVSSTVLSTGDINPEGSRLLGKNISDDNATSTEPQKLDVRKRKKRKRGKRGRREESSMNSLPSVRVYPQQPLSIDPYKVVTSEDVARFTIENEQDKGRNEILQDVKDETEC